MSLLSSSGILAQYQQQYQNVLNQISNVGGAGRQQLQQYWQGQQDAAQQSLVNSGLAGTTTAQSPRAGIGQQASLAMGQYNDQLAQLKAGYGAQYAQGLAGLQQGQQQYGLQQQQQAFGQNLASAQYQQGVQAQQFGQTMQQQQLAMQQQQAGYNQSYGGNSDGGGVGSGQQFGYGLQYMAANPSPYV